MKLWSDERRVEDEHQPSFYWYQAIVWAVLAGVCLGFLLGMVIAVVVLAR